MIFFTLLFFTFVAADNFSFPTPVPQTSVPSLPNDSETEPSVPDVEHHPEVVPDEIPEEPSENIPEDVPQEDDTVVEEPKEEPEPKRTRPESSVSVLSTFLSVAVSEEGYYHNGANTKYTGSFDYNGPEEWSAEFLAWCVETTGEQLSVQLGGDMFPWSDSVTDCFLWFISHGLFDDSGEFTPWGGDYVFLDLDGDGLIDRVGLVVETKIYSSLDLYGNASEETAITIICGNMPNSKKVEIFELSISDPSVSGFGVIN